MQPLDFKVRPSSGVPVPFFLVGLIGLVAVPVAAAVDPSVALHDVPGADGLLFLHLITLGFLAPVMLGAYYQLVPVVLHAPLPRPGWGHGVLAALAAGVVIFLCGWGFGLPAWIAGGGVLAGLALYGFLGHMAVALARVRTWSPTALAFGGALAALAAVALLGPVLALRAGGVPALPGAGDLLPAHVAAGLGGWLLLTVVGASYQLVPFFAATAPDIHPRFPYVAVVLIMAGVAALATGAAPAPAAGGGILVGLALWAADLARAARHGRQARREPVAAYTALAVALLVVAAAGAEADLMGATAAALSPRVLALAGLFAAPALLIAGQLQKILPFLASMDVALAAKRRGRVPKTEQLFPRAAAFRLLGPLAAGLIGLAMTAGTGSLVAVRLAAALTALAGGAYLVRQWAAVRAWRRAAALR